MESQGEDRQPGRRRSIWFGSFRIRRAREYAASSVSLLDLIYAYLRHHISLPSKPSTTTKPSKLVNCLCTRTTLCMCTTRKRTGCSCRVRRMTRLATYLETTSRRYVSSFLIMIRGFISVRGLTKKAQAKPRRLHHHPFPVSLLSLSQTRYALCTSFCFPYLINVKATKASVHRPRRTGEQKQSESAVRNGGDVVSVRGRQEG